MRILTRHPVATVTVVVLALAVPYFLAGPHFLADDYVWLRNARFDGWWEAGGPRLAGRPGGWLVTALTFGAIGPHPAVIYAIQTAVRLVAAWCVLRALAEFMSDRHALAVVLVWLVMPNHLAFEMWLSSLPSSIALVLLAGGITALARAHRTERTNRLIGAYLLLAAAIAVYELTAGVAVLAVVAVPYLVDRRPPRRLIAAGLAIVAVPAAWAAMRSTVYAHVPTGRLDPRLVFPGHLSLGFAPFGLQGRLVTGVGLAMVLTAFVRLVHPELRATTGFAERLTVAGAVVIVFGVAPLAAFATNFFGLHDRLLVVSGVGAAMVWTGAVLLVGQWVRRPAAVGVAAAVAFVAIAAPLRVIRTRSYEDAGQEAVRATNSIAEQVRGRTSLDLPSAVAVVDRVWGLNDGWNVTAAVQLALDDPRVSIGVFIDGVRSGPPPDQPRANF